MSWDNDTVRTLVSVITLVGVIATAVYSWWVARGKKTQSQLDQLTELNSKLDQRLTLLERDYSHAPGHQDLTQIRESIGRVSNALARIDGRVEGVGRAVDNMHNHLMDTSAAGRRASD